MNVCLTSELNLLFCLFLYKATCRCNNSHLQYPRWKKYFTSTSLEVARRGVRITRIPAFRYTPSPQTDNIFGYSQASRLCRTRNYLLENCQLHLCNSSCSTCSERISATMHDRSRTRFKGQGDVNRSKCLNGSTAQKRLSVSVQLQAMRARGKQIITMCGKLEVMKSKRPDVT